MVAVSLSLLAACSPAKPSMNGGDAGADVADARDATNGAFGASPCARCITSACPAALSDCASDPDCAAYWMCVEGCGVGSSGGVDHACEAACPTGTSSSGAQAELELTHCRTTGAGALCAACGTAATGAESPILKQHCSADAGPDAASDPCQRCIDEKCCETQSACDADCLDYTACMAKYDDYAMCKSAHPKGFLTAEQLHACITIACFTLPRCVTLSPLFACIVQECPIEYADLVATDIGASYWECLAVMLDGPGCLAQYPRAAKAAEAIDTCVQSECEIGLSGP